MAGAVRGMTAREPRPLARTRPGPERQRFEPWCDLEFEDSAGGRCDTVPLRAGTTRRNPRSGPPRMFGRGRELPLTTGGRPGPSPHARSAAHEQAADETRTRRPQPAALAPTSRPAV